MTLLSEPVSLSLTAFQVGAWGAVWWPEWQPCWPLLGQEGSPGVEPSGQRPAVGRARTACPAVGGGDGSTQAGGPSDWGVLGRKQGEGCQARRRGQAAGRASLGWEGRSRPGEPPTVWLWSVGEAWDFTSARRLLPVPGSAPVLHGVACGSVLWLRGTEAEPPPL